MKEPISLLLDRAFVWIARRGLSVSEGVVYLKTVQLGTTVLSGRCMGISILVPMAP